MSNAMSLVLGIDIGTSGTKVIAVTEDGQIAAAATASYEMQVPAPGFAEQNPEDWWKATISAIQHVWADVTKTRPSAVIAAISFSGQMHGLVPMDADGHVIRPAIIWCDVRSVAQAEWLEREIGREQLIAWTQNPALPNFTLTKLLWMKEHEPAAFARIATMLLPKDYVRLQMTGKLGMDVADASGTLLFDVARRRWSTEMCRATGIPESWLPPIAECNEIVGYLTKEASELIGIPVGIPIVAGAGDQAAGALGLGILAPGAVSTVFGTSGVVLAATERPIRDPLGRLHTFCHAQKDLWFMMGVTQAAGGSLQWYRRRLGQAEEDEAKRDGQDVYSVLLNEARNIPPGAQGLLFLPYLMGERTPHLDPQARGAWIGLSWQHERSHLLRAVLEGVAFSLRDCWEVMRDLGVVGETWQVSGGGAQGELWMQIFASVLGRSIDVVKGEQGPAFGAAILAAQGVGMLGTEAGSLNDWLHPGTTVEAIPSWVQEYAAIYPIFQQSYLALKPQFAALSKL